MSLTHRIFAQNVRDMRSAPAADVEAFSRTMLARLLRHAAAHVPSYRPLSARLLAAAGGDAAAWAGLPSTSEDGLRHLGAAGLSTSLPEGEDVLPVDRSWDSLSTPFDGALGLLGEVADTAQWEFLLHSHEVDTSASLAAILPARALRRRDLADGFGPWSIDGRGGRAHRWSDAMDPSATLAWLRNVEPAILFADASCLRRLLAAASPGALALRDVLLWRPADEPGVADECRRVFGARLITCVASDLGGFVASAGPSSSFVPALETAFVEIVDRDGHPCPPGEPGRLLATALYSYHRPVIRLDLGLRAVRHAIGSPDPIARPSFGIDVTASRAG